MGCKYTKPTLPEKPKPAKRIARLVMKNQEEFGKLFSKVDIDQELTQVNGVRLNALALALWYGKTKSFVALLGLGASLVKMHSLLSEHKVAAINLICKNGYLEILQHYLPYYEKHFQGACCQGNFTQEAGVTPIQVACYFHQTAIVKYLYKYFEKHPQVPFEFDVHYKNELNWENCALISARVADFELIQFLHYECGADFHILNKNQENAIQVCLAKKSDTKVLDCVKYLVEEAKVDITHLYEETLLLSSCELLTNFIEVQLKFRGIDATKAQVENYNCLELQNTPDLTKLTFESRLEEPEPKIPEELSLIHENTSNTSTSFLSQIL